MSATDDLIAAFCGREPAAFEDCCAQDIHYEDPMTSEPLESPGAVASHAQRLWKSFPDVRVESSGAALSDGRHIAAPCKVVGTHRGETEGLPASGK